MTGRLQERILAGELDEQIRPAKGSRKEPELRRHLVSTRASAIEWKATHWLWEERLPVGELCLLAGREGIGKSTVCYQLAAWITTGTMRGRFFGKPRSVLVAASEDSWERTIKPRLVGAGADLDRVLKVEVETTVAIPSPDGKKIHRMKTPLSLPRDVEDLAELASAEDVALLLLDPLISRLDGALDTHRDAEVRQALEPLVEWAHVTGVTVLGLIHVNKGASADALNLIMGSRAFPAVARSVLVAIKDPEDPERRVLGLEKSNLGSTEVAPYAYRIVGRAVGTTPEGDTISTGVVEWLGKAAQSVSEIISEASNTGTEDHASATREAAAWLEDFLKQHGHRAPKAEIAAAARAAGIGESALQRGRKRLKVKIDMAGYPRTSFWELMWGDETAAPKRRPETATGATAAQNSEPPPG